MILRIRKYTIEPVRRSFKAGEKASVSKKLLSSDGQVALVMILLAAVGLVFYAMALNYNRVADNKNTTMMAAQQSASVMASFMASYAQQLSVEHLKGRLKYCKSSSFLKSFMKTIILVVLAIICSIVPGLQGFAGYMWAAVAMSVAATAIDALVIQPSITDMWNKAMKNLSEEGYVIELGVQWGLRMAVQDNVGFPDLLDLNYDGVFGWEDPDNPQEKGWRAIDQISRFAFYYGERLTDIGMPEPSAINEFAKQLRSFVYYTNLDMDINVAGDETPVVSVWGLHDPVVPADPANPSHSDFSHPCNDVTNPPAECNSDCLPSGTLGCCGIEGCLQEDSEGNPISSAPCTGSWRNPELTDHVCCSSCVYPPEGIIANAACELPAAEGGCSGYMSTYPFVYDPFYENTRNDVFSFRENIGRDDESPLFRVDPDAPDWHSNAAHLQILRVAPPDLANPFDAYRVEDTSGFWEGDRQVVEDGKSGIYAFLYAIQDIGVALDALPTTAGYSCYWREETLPSTCNMGPYDDARKNSMIPRFSPLSLETENTLSGGKTVGDLGEGGVPDRVGAPTSLFLAEGTCAHNGPGHMGWKRGIDRFCSTVYPYHMECAKHGVNQVTGKMTCQDFATGDEGDDEDVYRDCFCGEAGAGDVRLFREDFFDDLFYGIPEFLAWAQGFLETIEDGQAAYMQKTIAQWYDNEVADWIEPSCDDSNCVPFCGPAQCEKCGGTQETGFCGKADAIILHDCCPGSVTKEARQGILYDWRDHMEWMYDQLTDWIFSSYTGPASCLGAGAVWCVPREDCGAPEGEAATFNSQLSPAEGHGIRGDMEDVVACLNWNVNDELTYYDRDGDEQSAVGNQKKFEACRDYCGPWACSELPRSLVSGGTSFEATDKEAYIYCKNSKTISECFDRCTPGNPLPQRNSLTGDVYLLPPQFFVPSNSDRDKIRALEREKEEQLALCNQGETITQPLVCSGGLPVIFSSDDCVEVAGLYDQCIKSWDNGSSCEFFAYSTGDQTFYDSVVALQDGDPSNDEADDTGGSCTDASFRSWIDDSAGAAENQVIKLRQRHIFLDYLLKEGLRIREIFGEAVDRFSEFLDNNTPYVAQPASPNLTTLGGAEYIDPDRQRVVEWSKGVVRKKEGGAIIPGENVYTDYSVDSPAELLIAIRSADDPEKKGDTSSVAVYVWRGPELETPRMVDGTRTTMGTVHAVKVEVRAPKRCNRACNFDGTGPQRRWPWIKTKTSGFLGTKRCYYLKNYTGMVKSRVIRYDEPIDQSSRVFRFANNVPIWGMRTTHPDVPDSSPAGIFTSGSACYERIHPLLRGIGEFIAKNDGAPQYLHHAFMLNDIPHINPMRNPGTPAGRYDLCWEDVHEYLLKYGVHSESCAVYQWESGDMGVRFVPCDENFSKGRN